MSTGTADTGKKGDTTRRGLGGAVLIIILAAGAFYFLSRDGGPDLTKPPSPLPQSEAALIATVVHARADYRAADNELRRSAVARSAGAALAPALKAGADGWIG